MAASLCATLAYSGPRASERASTSHLGMPSDSSTLLPPGKRQTCSTMMPKAVLHHRRWSNTLRGPQGRTRNHPVAPYSIMTADQQARLTKPTYM